MKFIQRLFIRKNHLQKAVNEDFTDSGIVKSVAFFYSNTEDNLKVLKKCLYLYKYDTKTIKESIEVLEEKLKNTIEWKKRRDEIKVYLSQGGLGNWAGRKNTLEDMIKTLKNYENSVNNTKAN